MPEVEDPDDTSSSFSFSNPKKSLFFRVIIRFHPTNPYRNLIVLRYCGILSSCKRGDGRGLFVSGFGFFQRHL